MSGDVQTAADAEEALGVIRGRAFASRLHDFIADREAHELADRADAAFS